MRCAVFGLLMLVLPVFALAGEDGDCPAPTLPPPEMLTALTLWIGQNTDYDVGPTLADPPLVLFCGTGDVIRYEGRDTEVAPGIRAALDAEARVIFLVLPWDARQDYDVSVLLHELIHDVQLLNRTWACDGAPEWEAYSLQADWLRARGIEPEFDWLRIYMISRCPRDIHPD